MSSLGFRQKDNYTRCINSAIYSLAMREHSRLELFRKLSQKTFAEGVDLNQLLDELEEKGYLNEERFVESFIRYRISRGQGPVKIRNELKQRGIQSHLITQKINEAEANWLDLAAQLLEKKYAGQAASDFKEKARYMRFLTARGFTVDVIRELV